MAFSTFRPGTATNSSRCRREASGLPEKARPARNAEALRLLAAPTDIRQQDRVRYEWDNGKAADNLRKHGVDFGDAFVALEDPNQLEEIDARFVYDEERVQVIGMAHGRVLFAVVTFRGEEICKVISARKATT